MISQTLRAKATLIPTVSAVDHRQGSDQAPVTLVEYGDFECPHCAHAFPIIEEVRRTVGSRLLFVFRHFPLREIHPHAEMAAEATEAAGSQGKFWEMHEVIFRNQGSLDAAHLARYATGIGVEMGRFLEDLSRRRFQKRVRENFMSGVRSGVNGTPTFFINGVRYDGLVGLREMVAAIEEAEGNPAHAECDANLAHL